MGRESVATAAILTPAEREKLRLAMIDQINATTRQVNILTQDVDSLKMQQDNIYNSLVDAKIGTSEFYEFCSRSFWQRLRWLVTGK